MSDIPPSVVESIANALQVSPAEITPELKAADIDNWDSLGTMAILLALETDFGLRLGPGQTSELQSVRRITTLLKEAGKLS